MFSKLNPLWFVAGICLLAGTFYAFAWPNAPQLSPDSEHYQEMVQDLRDFSLDELADRVPLYPVLLLLTRSAESPSRSLFYLQLLLHLLSVLMLATLCFRLRVTKKLIAVFVILAVLPTAMVNTALVMTEILTEFLIVVSLFTLVKWIQNKGTVWVIVSGFFVGMSALTRPACQLLFLILPLLILLCIRLYPGQRKRLLIGAGLNMIAGALLIAGYIIHNYVNFGYAGLTPLLGYNLSTRTVRFVDELPDRYSAVREILVQKRNQALGDPDKTSYYIYDAIPELEQATGLQHPELSRYLLNLNLFLIHKAPVEYLKVVARSTATYWFPHSMRMSFFGSKFLKSLLILIHFVVMSIFLLSTLLTLSFFVIVRITAGRQFRIAESSILKSSGDILAVLICCWGIIFYTMAVSTMIDTGVPRHRTPTDLLIFLATILNLEFWKRARAGVLVP